jgi:hypothetical protein
MSNSSDLFIKIKMFIFIFKNKELFRTNKMTLLTSTIGFKRTKKHMGP